MSILDAGRCFQMPLALLLCKKKAKFRWLSLAALLCIFVDPLTKVP